MGLSIHYKGKFNSKTSLSDMIEEIKDVAEVYNWEYHIYDTTFPKNSFEVDSFTQEVYGISFTPPECETVSFEFLSNGKMSNSALLMIWGKDDNYRPEYLYAPFVKTQYAGAEIHKIIIHLFKYISKKYFSEFEMVDEGLYWETGDEKKLDKIFKQYSNLIDGFTNSIQNVPKKSNETFENYFKRIITIIKNKKRNN